MRRVYVDADGVLVNFNKAFAPAFGLEYPIKSVLYHEWLLEASNTSIPDLFRIFEENPHLWHEAEPYPWTSDLVQVLDLKAPNWMILTTATHAPECWSGKVKWFKRYFTDATINKLLMIGCHKKSWIASKGDILIDDRRENITDWEAMGGLAFRWIDYTEDQVDLAQRQIAQVSLFLDEHLGLASTFKTAKTSIGL